MTAENNSPDFWWPPPSALNHLTVDEEPHGFSLSAKEGTECYEWLQYWSQDEEHQNIFEKEFTKVLLDYINYQENLIGKTQDLPDENSSD